MGKGGTIILRGPKLEDGAAMYRLVGEAGVLEQNTCYAYLLLATDFADTCVIAEMDGKTVGFVAGYIPPPRPEAVFVWQVGVAPAARRRGLGKRMLAELIARPACRDVRYLETTVTPSNAASRRLFTSFAEDLGVPCETQVAFRAGDFAGDEAHEDEERFRIGPWKDQPAPPGDPENTNPENTKR